MRCRTPGVWLLVLVLLTAPEAAAQLVNVQALFDEATSPLGASGGAELSLDWRTGSTELLAVRGEYGYAQAAPPITVSRFDTQLRSTIGVKF